MRGDYISEEHRQRALKEKLVREKGWYVPALHERYIAMRKGGEERGDGKG